jgi:hypothetical protein
MRIWLALALVLTACSRHVLYPPRADTYSALNGPQMRRAFAEALNRAIKPRIGSVEVTDERFLFDFDRTIHGPYGIPVGVVHDMELGIYWANVARWDLYTNHAVFVVGTNGRVLRKLVFRDTEDAEAFIDAAEAMRTRRAGLDSQ